MQKNNISAHDTTTTPINTQCKPSHAFGLHTKNVFRSLYIPTNMLP